MIKGIINKPYLIILIISINAYSQCIGQVRKYIRIDTCILNNKNGLLDFNLYVIYKGDTLFVPRVDYDKFANPIYYYNLEYTEKDSCKILVKFKDFDFSSFPIIPINVFNQIIDISYCICFDNKNRITKFRFGYIVNTIEPPYYFGYYLSLKDNKKMKSLFELKHKKIDKNNYIICPYCK